MNVELVKENFRNMLVLLTAISFSIVFVMFLLEKELGLTYEWIGETAVESCKMGIILVACRCYIFEEKITGEKLNSEE